jgi:glycosyltransferase involved in cell wall biosynthesis
MRVTYIHATPLPTPEANTVHVMQMCQAMAAAGHEVELLVPGGGDSAVKDVFAHYGVKRTFRLGRPWPSITHPGAMRAFATAAVAKAISSKADLIYTRNLLVADVATALGRPTVLEQHIRPSMQRPVSLRRLDRILRRPSLDRVVVISEALRELFISDLDMTGLWERILVAPDAAEAVDLPPRTGGAFTAAYAGSFYQGRGVEMVLALAEQLPDVRFRLVGGKPQVVAEMAGRAGPNVELTGYRPPGEVPGLLAEADVLLAPYQRVVMLAANDVDTAAFMSPLKVFEYMAAGRAIVASDLPVLREVLKDGETALLRDPDSLEAWRAALATLRDDVSLRQRLAASAKADFDANYTWDKRAERVLTGLKLDRHGQLVNTGMGLTSITRRTGSAEAHDWTVAAGGRQIPASTARPVSNRWGAQPVRQRMKDLEFQLPAPAVWLAGKAGVVHNPYVPEQDALGCTFVHVPKTAGTSLALALFGVHSHHVPAVRFQGFDRDRFERSFKFTIVRNPFDRLYSAYTYLRPHVGSIAHIDKVWASANLSRFHSFEEFVLALRQPSVRRRILRYLHFRPQMEWLRLPPSRANGMDFTARFERIAEDYQTIAERLGVEPPPLPKLRMGGHGDYRDVYSAEMKEVVARIYNEDFRALGYGFD